jgi:hypothetical protein
MDVAWADAALSLVVGIGLAAAAGLRVFLPLLVLGVAAHAGVVPLTPTFDWIGSGPGIAALATASVVEVVGYYIPWVDNLLDMIAGPLAVLSGIVLTAAVAGGRRFPPPHSCRWPRCPRCARALAPRYP